MLVGRESFQINPERYRSRKKMSDEASRNGIDAMREMLHPQAAALLKKRADEKRVREWLRHRVHYLVNQVALCTLTLRPENERSGVGYQGVTVTLQRSDSLAMRTLEEMSDPELLFIAPGMVDGDAQLIAMGFTPRGTGGGAYYRSLSKRLRMSGLPESTQQGGLVDFLKPNKAIAAMESDVVVTYVEHKTPLPDSAIPAPVSENEGICVRTGMWSSHLQFIKTELRPVP